jgi:hypothetical protein
MVASLLTVRRVRVVDALLTVWIVVWVLLGIVTGVEINKVAKLADSAVNTTTALTRTTEGLKVVSAVPLIGGGLGAVVDEVDALAEKANDDAKATRTSIEIVAWLSGFGIAMAPSLLILFLYLPWRLPWGRHVGSIRKALAFDPNDVGLDRYLAAQAVQKLTYDQVCVASSDPWAEIAAGNCRALADAELARMGIRRPSSNQS